MTEFEYLHLLRSSGYIAMGNFLLYTLYRGLEYVLFLSFKQVMFKLHYLIVILTLFILVVHFTPFLF